MFEIGNLVYRMAVGGPRRATAGFHVSRGLRVAAIDFALSLRKKIERRRFFENLQLRIMLISNSPPASTKNAVHGLCRHSAVFCAGPVERVIPS